VLGADAAFRLAESLVEETSGRRAAVLFDVRTREAAGTACRQGLHDAGFEIREHLLPDRGGRWPVCDERTKDAVRDALASSDIVVGVGSGVISDLTKWIAFEAGLPAAVFATAASMNGYAAANVAPAIGGVKTLVAARAHRAIGADPRVLAGAPAELTGAGLGDLIAKSVSTADWRLNHELFGEPYSADLVALVDDAESSYATEPGKLAEGDPAAIAALFEALVYSGCAMTLQGSSLPASGGEHLISHALDMRAEVEGGEHDLHGRQVGVATIFAAALYERILSLEGPEFAADPLPFDRVAWGAIGDDVARHWKRQENRLREACNCLRERDWDRVRETLGVVPAPTEIKSRLSQAGAAHHLEDIGVGRDRFLWAVRNCAQIRERFTSIDLGWVTGVLPGAAEEIVDQYLVH
jgi:glycerol-1-phosphate dehydrogenase [NAD(P)+]